MIESEYLKSIGARILSEANDLKRTVESMAVDLNIDSEDLQQVISGNCTRGDTFKIINLIEKTYPVDSSDLLLINDDCQNGILYFSADESKKTSRVFDRVNKKNKRTPYYEYRDTAMSKLSPFKPEWIKELRTVADSNPSNPDVAYNNGHFMHQITFFVGPVNFYYIVNGEKHCKEMNTGDSNYITPYISHSFANRDESQEAYIVAITFGGDVRRTQKELYALGIEKIKQYSLDIRNENKAVSQLIQQHMNNENLTKEMISDRVNVDKLLNVNRRKTLSEIEKIADLLNIESSDLMIPKYNKDHEVVVHEKSEIKAINYPNDRDLIYKIYHGSRVNKIPNLKSFDIHILSTKVKKEDLFNTSLHSYIYNYSETDILMVYVNDGEQYTQLLRTRDSVYVQPFVKYGFQNNLDGVLSSVFVARVSGGINFCTQKELSYFLDIERVVNENTCWFD